jgi:hypothetical protein
MAGFSAIYETGAILRGLELVGVVFCAILLSNAWRIILPRKRARADFDYGMQIIAKQAAERAKKELKIDLDFSPVSIDRIEEILSEIHKRHVNTPLNEEEISILALRWGAYIGEVLKRVRSGKWQRDSERMGPGTTPVVFGPGNEAFPRSWAYKRIVDGPEDNIVFKFRVLVDPRLRDNISASPLATHED